MTDELAWKVNAIALQQHFDAAQVDRALGLVNDPGWRAALTVLTSEIFENDARVWNHVDLRGHSIFFEEMLKSSGFSGAESRLLKLAASLFNEEIAVNLYSMFCTLDDQGISVALRAITAFTTDDHQRGDLLPEGPG